VTVTRNILSYFALRSRVGACEFTEAAVAFLPVTRLGVSNRARILKICSVCMGMGSVIPLPLYFFRMVAKGIISVFCYFALLAFISKSVDSLPVSMTTIIILSYYFVNCFGIAYSFTKSGDRWLDRSVGSQNST